MPKRIPQETVTVVRNGKRHTPPIGQPFDFTAAEIAEIVGTKANPGLRPSALKKVFKEDPDEEVADVALPDGPKDLTAEPEKGEKGSLRDLGAAADDDDDDDAPANGGGAPTPAKASPVPAPKSGGKKVTAKPTPAAAGDDDDDL